MFIIENTKIIIVTDIDLQPEFSNPLFHIGAANVELKMFKDSCKSAFEEADFIIYSFQGNLSYVMKHPITTISFKPFIG